VFFAFLVSCEELETFENGIVLFGRGWHLVVAENVNSERRCGCVTTFLKKLLETPANKENIKITTY
jgi:hypothetical protein